MALTEADEKRLAELRKGRLWTELLTTGTIESLHGYSAAEQPRWEDVAFVLRLYDDLQQENERLRGFLKQAELAAGVAEVDPEMASIHD